MDLFVRDPFILPDTTTKTYYLYSSAYDKTVMPNSRNGVVVYASNDLNTWTGPTPVFEIPATGWPSTERCSLKKARLTLFSATSGFRLKTTQWKLFD
jgi:hypothetical protein